MGLDMEAIEQQAPATTSNHVLQVERQVEQTAMQTHPAASSGALAVTPPSDKPTQAGDKPMQAAAERAQEVSTASTAAMFVKTAITPVATVESGATKPPARKAPPSSTQLVLQTQATSPSAISGMTTALTYAGNMPAPDMFQGNGVLGTTVFLPGTVPGPGKNIQGKSKHVTYHCGNRRAGKRRRIILEASDPDVNGHLSFSVAFHRLIGTGRDFNREPLGIGLVKNNGNLYGKELFPCSDVWIGNPPVRYHRPSLPIQLMRSINSRESREKHPFVCNWAFWLKGYDTATLDQSQTSETNRSSLIHHLTVVSRFVVSWFPSGYGLEDPERPGQVVWKTKNTARIAIQAIMMLYGARLDETIALEIRKCLRESKFGKETELYELDDIPYQKLGLSQVPVLQIQGERINMVKGSSLTLSLLEEGTATQETKKIFIL